MHHNVQPLGYLQDQPLLSEGLLHCIDTGLTQVESRGEGDIITTTAALPVHCNITTVPGIPSRTTCPYLD